MTHDHEPHDRSDILFPVLLSMLGLLAACASDRTFGGRAIPVELMTRCQEAQADGHSPHDCHDPMAATAWIVDLDDWMAGGFDESIHQLDTLMRHGATEVSHAREALVEQLAPYRRDDGPTPITTKLQPHAAVFVAEREGVFRYVEFTPDVPYEHITVSFH